MKKTLLLFLFLIPFLGSAQLASASYVIGNSQPAPFKTLATAITSINSTGIAGPVTLLLDENQTVTSTIFIDRLDFSAAKTLTIKPNTNRNITITGNIGNTSTAPILKLEGTDYVTIDGSNNNTTSSNLIISNTSTVNYNNFTQIHSAILWITNKVADAATNNTLRNIQFVGSGVDATSSTSAGVVISGANNMQTAETISNSNNTISNNIFIRMKFGIWTFGGTSYNQNLTINNNTFGSANAADVIVVNAIKLSNTQNTLVTGNSILGVAMSSNSTFISGINLYDRSIGCTISRNRISSVKSSGLGSGIHIDLDNSVTANLNIVNNFISGIASSTGGQYDYNNAGHGIYFVKGNRINLYYNTVVLNVNQTGLSASLFISDGSNLDIRNNIFYNSQTGSGLRYAVYSLTNRSVFSNINRNDYITSSGGTLGRLNNADAATIADWRVATSQDGNSLSVAPSFVSASDFHLITNNTNNESLTGVTISGITTDIDGDTRVKPYMGADELVQCTPSGDQTTFGVNSWLGYVYSWTGTAYPNPATSTTLPVSATSTYIGTVTENALFDRNVTSGQVNGVTRNIPCDTPPSDKFFVRYKMQTTTAAGRYNFTIGGDDGVRLYVDGSLVTVAPTGSYGVHSYNTYAAQVDLTAGTHNFILEYFENDGDSRVSFSYGQIQGNVALPFGDNKWNVYGFTVANINLPSYAYAGMYVDNNVNVNTQASWGRTSSPSAASSWLGAPVGVDQFTITYKRQGFPCGRYQIQLVNCDDMGEIYVDGTKVFTQNGYTGTSAIINGGTTYLLNKNSTVEIRLREDGGDANIAVNFIDTPTVYNGSGTLASDTSIRISANTTLGSDLQVCSCTVDTGVTFTIPANRTLTVDETINVAGTGKLLIQNNGSLLQKNTTAAAYTGAVTSFEMQRNTAPVRRYDFSYWSSPVTLASNFTLYKLSPNTLGDKYYSYNPNSGWAINYNGTQVMTPGQGYIVRAPQSFDMNSTAVYTASFIGVPNNGDVTITPVGGQWNLIGNPYPSALDAQKLMTANNNVGSLYFWTHNSPPSNTVSGDATYNYTSNDYAVYNFSGGVATSSGAAAPSGYIAAGQSFFINASSSNNIVFTNDMRVGGNNTQFFKTAKAAEEVERNRLWLNFTNTQGAFKQALVGYIEGATNSLDNGFDAETMAGNSYVDFYSINDALQLTIQGRALPFENSDIIPLGYNTSIAGDFTISIDHVDGMFNDQAVYLEDKKTSTIYDLKAGDYTFKTEAGTFDDRFTLRYTNKTLGTGDFENVDNGLLVSVKDKVIKVTSNKENIKSTAIYDISGRLIYDKNKVGTTELQISNLQSADQVLLVKIILENNYTLTKKIIFK
jgi:hypothetical protein